MNSVSLPAGEKENRDQLQEAGETRQGKDKGAGTALQQPGAVKLVQPLSCNDTEIVYQESNHD